MATVNGSAQLVGYPNGAVAPLKTPEVAAAEAAHFAAKDAIFHHNTGAHAYHQDPYHYAHAPYHYAGLVSHPNGAVVPADTPALVAAKAQHFAAKGHPVAPIAFAAPAAYGAFGGLVAHPNGALVPAEPADVVAARAAHLAAHG